MTGAARTGRPGADGAGSRPRLLNLGCGPTPAAGWINCDRRPGPGVDFRFDLHAGLPLRDACIDAIAAIHVLQDLPWDAQRPVLAELRRVLVDGGRLRLALPDLDRAIEAYRSGDAGYFLVPDAHARRLGAKLVTQVIWYGSVRTPFTFDFAAELLHGAGFRDVARRRFGETGAAGLPLAALDNRERESLFVEACR